ncbi:T9SS type A sorting domain-containing protein [Rhodoflexus caldus]|uniref:T9SS type A sorting domain-containing protein n=1 Tax=Rhodoflexus caldus TaxID=2891236 RepID=UPI002029E058|nr:T9SS type A sorting domain-containing protein [Rhodoflexus caldus]
MYDGASTTSIPNLARIEQAQWSSTSSNVQVVANPSNGLTATVFANTFTGQWVTLMVRVRNCAGWSGWQSFQVFVCNGFSGWRFSYGPNPGDDILTIKAVPDETRTNTADLNGKQQVPPAFTAILFNNRAEEVLRGESDNNGQLTLSVSKLPRGVYFLHILGTSGELLEKKQIQIGAPLSY